MLRLKPFKACNNTNQLIMHANLVQHILLVFEVKNFVLALINAQAYCMVLMSDSHCIANKSSPFSSYPLWLVTG